MKKIIVPKNQLTRLEQMLTMAERFAPEAVQDATVKVVVEDDLADEEVDQGVGAIFYIDDATYAMARKYGGPVASADVHEVPKNAQDYFDL